MPFLWAWISAPFSSSHSAHGWWRNYRAVHGTTLLREGKSEYLSEFQCEVRTKRSKCPRPGAAACDSVITATPMALWGMSSKFLESLDSKLCWFSWSPRDTARCKWPSSACKTHKGPNSMQPLPPPILSPTWRKLEPGSPFLALPSFHTCQCIFFHFHLLLLLATFTPNSFSSLPWLTLLFHSHQSRSNSPK